MSKKPFISDEIIINALKSTDGLVYSAAELISCSFTTIYQRMKNVPAVKEAREAARGLLLDVAESELFKKIKSGDLEAIKYALSRIGKSRGWTIRHELTGADGEALFKTDLENMDESKLRNYLRKLAETATSVANSTDDPGISDDCDEGEGDDEELDT